ncbi:MAG: tetratricopeptide repeat protein, partial [Planctomycetes bacterium]|nr:tetratricopeptide repeat protein [Planctomycetota bacterium]
MSSLGQALTVAVQNHQAGNLAVAEPIYRQILALHPHQPDALHFLGLLIHQTGRHQEGLDLMRQAVQIQGTNPGHHNNLGNVYRALGQLDEAKASYQRALQLKPDFVEAHKNLGAVCDEQGKFDDAVSCYRRALQLTPQDADLFNRIAIARTHDGRLEEAIEACRRALALRPNFYEALTTFGNARSRQGRQDEAIAAYKQALALNPAHVEALNNMGIALTAIKAVDEAADCFRRAREICPATAASLFSLGKQLKEVGDFPGADRCWRETLQLDPRQNFALAELILLNRGKSSTADMEQAQALLADSQTTDTERASLDFALAHACDDRADFAGAARYLEEANALKISIWQSRGESFSKSEHDRFTAALIEQFSPEYFQKVAGWGVDSERPVFVFGMPRSGTTLIEQILGSHSQIFGAGELELASAAFNALPQWTGSSAVPELSAHALDALTTTQISQQYLQRLTAINSETTHIVDKTPGNFLYLGLLATLFPRAKFIHCRRQVRDVALSCWMSDFRYLIWASEKQALAGYIQCYLKLMDHWRRVLPVPVLEIDYETMVAEPEETARRLLAWCGLEWEPACLEFHARRQPVRTVSAAQVR